MEFLKTESSYLVTDTKKDAVQLLKQDSRVDKVRINLRQCIVITTYPIKPICKNRKYGKVIKYPIGTYTITLKPRLNSISVYIKRIHGGTGKNKRDIHPHINLEGTDNGICWGSVQTEVDEIKKNRDWLWLAKRALDILEDGEPEIDSDGDLRFQGLFVRIIIELQVKYLREKYGNSQQNKKRMKMMYELYDKYYVSSEDI